MQSLARGILVVVTLFVAVLAGTLIVKSRSGRVDPTRTELPHADLSIKEVRLEEEAGDVRWRLSAQQALIFEQEGRTTLRGISVHVEDPRRSWTIVGEEGDLFQQTKDVVLRNGVVVTSSDGIRLETDVLRWHGSEKRLWTDARVRVSRSGSVVEGTGLEFRMAEDVTTLHGRVRATFVKGSDGWATWGGGSR